MKQLLVVIVAVLLVQAAFAKSKCKKKNHSSDSGEKKKKSAPVQTCQACPPPEVILIKEVTVCDGQQLTLSCPLGSSIMVHEGYYGRKNTHTCRHPSATNGESVNEVCSSTTALQSVRNRCNGQRECDLTSAKSWLEDPCRGTSKYLEVSYSCAATPSQGNRRV